MGEAQIKNKCEYYVEEEEEIINNMGTYAVELLIITINLSCWALLLHHLCSRDEDGEEKEEGKVDKLALCQT